MPLVFLTFELKIPELVLRKLCFGIEILVMVVLNFRPSKKHYNTQHYKLQNALKAKYKFWVISVLCSRL